MKALYLSASIILTALILILSFENISAQCSQVHFLIFPITTSPTFIFLMMAVLGILTGIMYHAFLAKILESNEEGEDEDF